MDCPSNFKSSQPGEARFRLLYAGITQTLSVLKLTESGSKRGTKKHIKNSSLSTFILLLFYYRARCRQYCNLLWRSRGRCAFLRPIRTVGLQIVVGVLDLHKSLKITLVVIYCLALLLNVQICQRTDELHTFKNCIVIYKNLGQHKVRTRLGILGSIWLISAAL